MGYTHYYRIRDKNIPKKTFTKIADDIEKVVAYIRDNKIECCTADITWDGPIQLDFERGKLHDDGREFIDLNGVDEYSHENLVLYEGKHSWSFCKTNRKPYDTAICMALLVTKWHLKGACKLSSDGNNIEWQGAYELWNKIFPRRKRVWCMYFNGDDDYHISMKAVKKDFRSDIANVQSLLISKDTDNKEIAKLYLV